MRFPKSNRPLYRIDPTTGAFVAAPKSNWRRFGLPTLLLLAAVAAGTFALQMHLQHSFGSLQAKALSEDNDRLRATLATHNQQLDAFTQQIETLAQTDRHLYRTFLDVAPISEEVRQVGVGGTDVYGFSEFSKSSAAVLRGSAQRLERLLLQVRLQEQSFLELRELAEQHRAALVQRPAINPTDGPMVSHYGHRIHPVLNKRRMHYGVDFGVWTGTAVYATGNGIVKRTGYDAGLGRFVEIEHPDAGYITRYAHLSRIPTGIHQGKVVLRGEQIGISGNTGLSSGPHLHYEVRTLDGSALNPKQFLSLQVPPQTYREITSR